nr:reverse transcriptase domain-containing protein [Tanacetum cinerariifolium]
APPSPDYIPGPEHADDEIVVEDQPYAEDASPIAQSPEYVPESDFAAHPEDDDDEDLKKDPVDYPADEGDENDDEEESSEDDEDDDMDIEVDEEEEEEEHPASADSVVVASTAADQAPSTKETEPFETDESAATPPPHPAYRMIAKISIPAPVPMPAWTDSEIIPFPPLPPILSPPSHVLSPAPPPSPIRSLGYRAAMIRLRDEAASTSSLPLQLPSASRREDRPEVTLPLQKRLGIALGPRYEVGESSSVAAARPARGLRADYGFVATVDREIMRDPQREVSYGITNLWDEIVETLQGAPVSTDTELGGYMREFETRVRQDTDEIYMRCQMSEIRELQAADRRRHTVISELLRTYHRRSTEITELRTALQGQVTALHGQVTALQAMIDQGVTTALAVRDALRSTNGDDSHNSGTGTVGHEAAYGMSWKMLMKMMTKKYCPRNEIRKLEIKLWDLKVKGTDLASYTQRYQELALLCGRMFSKESDKIKKYIRGLPDMIHGSVVASKPKTMQETIEIATELMDKKIHTFAERETASKRKFKNTSRNTQNQQQQSNKRQNTGRVYTAASGEKKQYGDLNPYALNAIITMTVHVILSAATATKLVILPVTVGIRQIPIMLTIRGALG